MEDYKLQPEPSGPPVLQRTDVHAERLYPQRISDFVIDSETHIHNILEQAVHNTENINVLVKSLLPFQRAILSNGMEQADISGICRVYEIVLSRQDEIDQILLDTLDFHLIERHIQLTAEHYSRVQCSVRTCILRLWISWISTERTLPETCDVVILGCIIRWKSLSLEERLLTSVIYLANMINWDGSEEEIMEFFEMARNNFRGTEWEKLMCQAVGPDPFNYFMENTIDAEEEEEFLEEEDG